MSRQKEFERVSVKPASMYLSWSSNDGKFKYWNKEASKDELIDLPMKFVVLMERHTVKGWHDKSQSGIYSNEVKNIGSEQLEVKSFKGGVIAKGIYKECKEVIQNAGGTYHKSIYAMLEDGTIINLSIKGACVKAWGDFSRDNSRSFTTKFVSINGVSNEKKGSIKYTVPVFELSDSLDATQMRVADDAYDRLDDSLNRVVNALHSHEQEDLSIDELEEDDIDF